MKKFRFRSLVWAGFIFLFSLNLILLLAGLIRDIIGFIIVAIILSLVQIVLHDLFARKHSTLRYYPFKAWLKYILGKISPFVPKFLFKDEPLRTTVSNKQYELIVNRANNISSEVIRNNLLHPDDPGFEGIGHPIYTRRPVDFRIADLVVQIGNFQCSQPYTLNVLDIGGLNQNVLNNATIHALSEGANIQGCAVNTGKGGISPFLIRGGSDLIWQIAHEDYAFHRDDSSFNEKLFEVTATRPYVKMIEIVLPRHELSIMKRLAGNRMILFLKKLRDLSEGKPIGIRLFNPSSEVINGICKSMYATRVYLDFITIDSAVSESGFDSFTVSNASSASYFESLTRTKKAIISYGLPTKIIASGAIVSEYDILRSIALGASACYCTAPMILAVRSGSRLKFKDPVGQRLRVANFHRNTIDATLKLMDLCGYDTLHDVKPEDFYRKIDFFEIKSLKEIFFDDQPVKSPHLFSGLS
jgi:glutamate synthase domain-containing protein 2